MVICQCSRSLSRIESTASNKISEAATAMSKGVNRIGVMLSPDVQPPCDSAGGPAASPGLGMGYQQKGCSICHSLLEQRLHPSDRFFVEGAGRFIQEQNRRVERQCADQGQSLLLAG